MQGVPWVAAVVLLSAASFAGSSGAGGSLERCRTNPELPRGIPLRARDVDLQFSWSRESSHGEERWLWKLSLRNRTRSEIALSFPYFNRFAVVTVRRDGRLVYSSSSGGFTAFSYRALGPLETYACTLGPVGLDLGPGRYEVAARVDTHPRPVVAKRWFTLAPS